MARLALPVFLIATVMVSCISSPTNRDAMSEPGWTDRTSVDLMVRVQNDHYDPVRITAVWPDMSYYLGEVSPSSTARLRVPGYLLESRGGPRFLADPIGSAQDQVTRPVDCTHARIVEWRIKRNMHPSRPRVMTP